MATWMISALRLLGIGVGAEAGATAIERATGIDIPLLGTVFGQDKPKRRRRKRMLTAGDMADIGFLNTVLTKAGLASVVAMRVRG